MEFLKSLFAASNAKAVVTFVVGLVVAVVARFGYHATPDDTNAILAVALFAVGWFVHDGSIGNWRSTLAGFIGAVLYGLGRFGLHVPPDLQAGIIALTGTLIGWFRQPLPSQE